jgi:hypothetical protein
MSTSINTCLAPTPMPQATPASPGFGAVLDYKPKSPTQLRPYIKDDSPDAGTLRNLLNSAGVKTDGRPLADAVTEFQTNYNKGSSSPIGVDGKAGSETLGALQKQIRGIDQSDRMFSGGAVTRDPAQKAFLDRPIDYSAMNKPANEASVSGATIGSASAGGGDAAVRAALDKKLAAAGGKDVHQVTDGIGNKKDVQVLSPDSPGSRVSTFATTPELRAALDAKDGKVSAAGGAKPARSVTTIEGDIAAKKAEIRALEGAPDPASVQLRQQKIDGLKVEQQKLEASPEFKAVKGLRDNQAKLKALEEDRMILPSGKDIEERTTSIRKLRDEVAVQEKAVAPFRARVEGEEKRITGDLFGLQHRYASNDTQHHFDGQVTKLRGDVTALEAEMKAHPGYKDLMDYRAAKANLTQLRADTMFMPSGADIEKRMKSIEQAESIVRRYEAKPS